MCRSSYSEKVWRSSFYQNKVVLKKWQHIREGKSLFEKKKRWRLIFPKRFPHPYKYSRGISYEYLPGWPERTQKEIIRLCLSHAIFINFKVMYYKLKKIYQFQKQPPELFYRKSCSEKFCNIHTKTPVLESPFNRLAGLKTCNFLKKIIQHRCFPVNISKFLRTLILTKICEQLLLQLLPLTVNISSWELVSALNSIGFLQESSSRFKEFSLGCLVVGFSLIWKKRKISQNGHSFYHSLSFLVIRCRSLSLVVIRCH